MRLLRVALSWLQSLLRMSETLSPGVSALRRFLFMQALFGHRPLPPAHGRSFVAHYMMVSFVNLLRRHASGTVACLSAVCRLPTNAHHSTVPVSPHCKASASSCICRASDSKMLWTLPSDPCLQVNKGFMIEMLRHVRLPLCWLVWHHALLSVIDELIVYHAELLLVGCMRCHTLCGQRLCLCESMGCVLTHLCLHKLCQIVTEGYGMCRLNRRRTTGPLTLLCNCRLIPSHRTCDIGLGVS